MKNLFLIVVMLFYMSSLSSQNMQWQKCLGGTSVDQAYSIQQTTDAGYIIAGYTSSNDGDVSGNHGEYDYWIVKLDSLGVMQWQKCLGGSYYDQAYSIQQTTDAGYIIAGYTSSNDGDVSGNHGQYDYWIIKLDSLGVMQWQKCLGGSSYDQAYSIQQTTDAGYIIAGYARSNDGDVSGNHGQEDYWIVKLDSLGVIQWQKCLGGSSADYAQSIQQTTDAGYIIAGYTRSNDGNVSGNHGWQDYWIVKIDSLGILQWQKCLGGSSADYAQSIQQTTDAGYVIAGYTLSNDGDVSGNHGDRDYWIVKLDSLGVLQWQKCLGGSYSDYAESIQQTLDVGYIIAGWTNSNDGDVSGKHAGWDYWIVKLDSLGVLQWQKCLGGNSSDQAYSIQQITDSCYIIAGSTRSNNGDVSGNHGSYDYWIVKFHEGIKNQAIELNTGWNIMSFNAVPDDINLLNILQPLVASNELIKVIDESGGFIQEIPGIGWMNTIGDMANTEGYYIKVNQNTQLGLIGWLVNTPFDISLITGWNIMGYPVSTSENAMNIFDQLITPDSTLIKVIDEAGGFIQYIPGVGWMNTVDSLSPGEGYHIKVSANDTLTLGIEVPAVTTDNITNITQTTATTGGNVTSDGGATVTARGVCWSTSTNPTLADSYTTDGTGTGTFVSNITGLTANTQYYVRAYATNSEGTMYGDEKSFVTLTPCNGITSFIYEGQTYNTVEIGNQCWMAENLNVGIRIDGVNNQTDNDTIEKYCYNNDTTKCDTYGGLYQWNETMQYTTTQGAQGICPTGWHLPTDDEWKILEGTVDSQYPVGDPEWNIVGWRGYDAGKNLKSTSGWTGNGNGTNSYGFTGLSAGIRQGNGSFSFLGALCRWWSSSEASGTHAIDRGLGYNYDEVLMVGDWNIFGFSVRCLKD